RALRRPFAAEPQMAREGAEAQPALLDSLGAGGEEAREMKKLLALLAVATASAFALSANAQAHPLGNFTINTFSRVQVSGDRVYVRYVLDMAEIPTFQAGHIDATAYANRLAAGAHLTVDGHAARLVATTHALAHPKGAGG